MRIVGIALVHNEDRFLRRSLLNVSGFCDEIVVADHRSTDGTAAILHELAGEIPSLEVVAISHSAASHDLVEPLAGTETWVLSVDGDELYDPEGLVRLRTELEAGEFDGVFRIRPAALHCDVLDEAAGRATGFLSPPSRPLLGLFNFNAIVSWTGVKLERLHGGDIRFREGFDMNTWRHLGSERGWERSPFRALHVCFLPRSSRDAPTISGAGRPNLSESGAFRRGAVGQLERSVRRLLGRTQGSGLDTEWKANKYRRGERVTVDALPFLVHG